MVVHLAAKRNMDRERIAARVPCRSASGIHSRQYSGLSRLRAHETVPETVPTAFGSSARTIHASCGSMGYGGRRPKGIAGTNPDFV